jgi:hypothetical protein
LFAAGTVLLVGTIRDARRNSPAHNHLLELLLVLLVLARQSHS